MTPLQILAEKYNVSDELVNNLFRHLSNFASSQEIALSMVEAAVVALQQTIRALLPGENSESEIKEQSK